MKKGASYLRYAAAAAFIAAAAWTLAFFIGREQSPKTVTAQRADVKFEITVEGMILRDEQVIVCDGEGAYIAPKTGDRVRGGDVVAVPKDMLDDYLTHLELSGGAMPDRGEMRTLVYARNGGIFSTFVDGYESADIDDILSAEPFIPQGAVGKIVLGGWYFVAKTPEAARLRCGQKVIVSLPDEVPATVVSAQDGRLVLRCRAGLEDVINTRHAAFVITLSETEGINIPDRALHSDADGAFVYVMRAGTAERCKIEIIGSGDGYVLVREGEVRENMQIISDQNFKYKKPG